MTKRGKQTAHALRPHNSHLALSFIIALACCSTLAADDLYFDHVKPLLRSRCFACHGALKQESGLRLDASGLILMGGG